MPTATSSSAAPTEPTTVKRPSPGTAASDTKTPSLVEVTVDATSSSSSSSKPAASNPQMPKKETGVMASSSLPHVSSPDDGSSIPTKKRHPDRPNSIIGIPSVSGDQVEAIHGVNNASLDETALAALLMEREQEQEAPKGNAAISKGVTTPAGADQQLRRSVVNAAVATSAPSVEGSKIQTRQQQQQQQQQQPQQVNKTAMTSSSHSTAAAVSPSSSSASSREVQEDIDEELRRAEAMALAIAANPNLTPDELKRIISGDTEQRKLVEEKLQKQQQQHHHHQQRGGGIGGGGGVGGQWKGLHLGNLLAGAAGGGAHHSSQAEKSTTVHGSERGEGGGVTAGIGRTDGTSPTPTTQKPILGFGGVLGGVGIGGSGGVGATGGGGPRHTNFLAAFTESLHPRSAETQTTGDSTTTASSLSDGRSSSLASSSPSVPAATTHKPETTTYTSDKMAPLSTKVGTDAAGGREDDVDVTITPSTTPTSDDRLASSKAAITTEKPASASSNSASTVATKEKNKAPTKKTMKTQMRTLQEKYEKAKEKWKENTNALLPIRQASSTSEDGQKDRSLPFQGSQSLSSFGDEDYRIDEEEVEERPFTAATAADEVTRSTTTPPPITDTAIPSTVNEREGSPTKATTKLSSIASKSLSPKRLVKKPPSPPFRATLKPTATTKNGTSSASTQPPLLSLDDDNLPRASVGSAATTTTKVTSSAIRPSSSMPPSIPTQRTTAQTASKHPTSSAAASTAVRKSSGFNNILTSFSDASSAGVSPELGVGTGGIETTDENEPPVRLTGIAYKRRSGFGKLSVKHAWGRRRIVLRGTKLYYYKAPSNKEEKNEDDNSERSVRISSSAQDSMRTSSTVSSDGTGGGGGTSLSAAPAKSAAPTQTKKYPSFWEQAAINLQTARDNLQQLAAAASAAAGEPSDPNAPRGVLDIVKEHATIAATTGHSGAPTPFALSIKVKNETKWKLCFNTHHEQMEWLAAMTDVVVKNSVEEYNAALLEREMGSSSGSNVMGTAMTYDWGDTGQFLTGAGRMLTNMSPSVTSTEPESPPPPPSGEGESGGGRGRIWKLEPYTISSRSLVDEEISPTEEEGEEDEGGNGDERGTGGEDAEEEDAASKNVVKDDTDASKSRALPAVLESSSSNISDMCSSIIPLLPKCWVLRGHNLNGIVLLVNGSLYYARASSSSTMARYIFLITLVNWAIWMCVVRENATSSGKTIEDETVEVNETDSNPRLRLSRKATSKKRRTSKEGEKETTVETSPTVKVAPVGYKPVAGTTTVRLENSDDPPINSKDEKFGAWRLVPGSDLMVRSHGYLSTKKKVPSPGELYDCARVDLFETAARVPKVATRVQLPHVKFDDGDGVRNWHAPDVFVVSLALPTRAPKLGRGTDDGEGYNIVMYFTMKEGTRKILKEVTSSEYDPTKLLGNADIQKSKVNGVRLWNEWCRKAPTDPKFQARFKLVPNAQNMTEIGMPKWIAQYSGKPVLIKRAGVTGFLYSYPELNAMEFDISFHAFPYLFKQAMAYLKDNMFKKLLGTIGFVIEGRDDDELPEVVIGSMQICYPDPDNIIQGTELFAGTSRKSFEVDN